MISKIANKLGIAKAQTLCMILLCLFLAGLLCWIGYHGRPQRANEDCTGTVTITMKQGKVVKTECVE